MSLVPFSPVQAIGRSTADAPQSGAKLWFFLYDTNTPVTVYQTPTGTAHTNPVVADANGAWPAIYWDNAIRTRVKKTAAAALNANSPDWQVLDIGPPEGLSSDLSGVDVTPEQAATFREEIGAASSDFLQLGDDAEVRDLEGKVRETVSITDYGASSSATAAENTAAIQAAMKYLMDRFQGEEDAYPGGPGDPTDFYARDRRTGRIVIPAGTYRVLPNVFSSLEHDRATYVGFEFLGEHRRSSVLLLETGGAEAWFYDNGAGNEVYQTMYFRQLDLRSDDYRYGGFWKMYSVGGPKQLRCYDCEFNYLQTLLYTEGSGNADLSKFSYCYGMFYGDLLVLDNPQSVQHDFVGSDLGTYANLIKVKTGGGGNVNIANSSIDFIWHEDYSPAGGNAIFTHEAGANIAQGNCVFTMKNSRVEVEAYKRTAGAPPISLVRCVDSPTSFPRVSFEEVNFVNGKTYTIDADGDITGEELRRITAVHLYPGKYVEFKSCVMLKTFFYNVTGDRDTNSPAFGGILRFTDCYDGVSTELPAADAALENLHSRVTYSGSAGRVITGGMTEHTTGSSFIRKVLDADPNFQKSFGREPSSQKKIVHFKHVSNAWPYAGNNSNDHYLDIPPGFKALRLYVKKPAVGAVTNAYQLHIKATDRTGATLYSSTLAQFKDEHLIDQNHIDLSAYTRICLCATGTGTDFDNGGFVYVEFC